MRLASDIAVIVMAIAAVVMCVDSLRSLRAIRSLADERARLRREIDALNGALGKKGVSIKIGGSGPSDDDCPVVTITGNCEHDVATLLQDQANEIAELIIAYPEQRRDILRRAFARRLGALDADGCDGVAFASALRAAAIAAVAPT